MSVNNKVKVLWKTNCQWRDRPHWPKRKEIKANSADNGKELSSLKPGNAVRVNLAHDFTIPKCVRAGNPDSQRKVNISNIMFQQLLLTI